MSIAVLPLDPDDERVVARAYEIHVAGTRQETPDAPEPCRYAFTAGLRHPWPGDRDEWSVATLDGELVGCAQLSFPQLDNPGNLSVEIYVDPAYRRRGVGRALFVHATERAREDDRKRIMSTSVAAVPDGPPRDPAGTAFAEALGASAALTEVRRRLDLGGVDEPRLDALLRDAWGRADGYSLVQWRNVTPEEYVDDVAYLDGRLLQDAPLGDLAWEPEKVDAARVRAAERALAARQRRSYHTGVRHDASGRLVAWTLLAFSRSTDWHSWQGITLVEPRHRGHRLGTVVKLENLRYARANESQLRIIDTFNAAENDHMITINEAMGFRPVDASINWQLTL